MDILDITEELRVKKAYSTAFEKIVAEREMEKAANYLVERYGKGVALEDIEDAESKERRSALVGSGIGAAPGAGIGAAVGRFGRLSSKPRTGLGALFGMLWGSAVGGGVMRQRQYGKRPQELKTEWAAGLGRYNDDRRHFVRSVAHY